MELRDRDRGERVMSEGGDGGCHPSTYGQSQTHPQSHTPQICLGHATPEDPPLHVAYTFPFEAPAQKTGRTSSGWFSPTTLSALLPYVRCAVIRAREQGVLKVYNVLS